MPSSDIILIGAGRSPHTKQLRARKGFPKRNLWVGSIQVRTGMRFPIDAEFLKKHYDVIAKGVSDGVLLIEYKFDKYVDAEELKTLAFGSEAEKAAYEEEAGSEAEASAEKLAERAQEKHTEDEQVADQKVGDDGLAPPADLEGEVDPKQDNLEGSHEEPITSPRQLADALVATTSGDAPKTELPEGWRGWSKTDLQTLCEERGVDVSDGPSSREMKRRLDAYAGT